MSALRAREVCQVLRDAIFGRRMMVTLVDERHGLHGFAINSMPTKAISQIQGVLDGRIFASMYKMSKIFFYFGEPDQKGPFSIEFSHSLAMAPNQTTRAMAQWH